MIETVYLITVAIAFFPLTSRIAWHLAREFGERPGPLEWTIGVLTACVVAWIWLPVLVGYLGRRVLFRPPSYERERIRREDYEELQRRNAQLERELGIGQEGRR